MADWHPDAARFPEADAGDMVSGTGRKIVWHTTETRGFPDYAGTAPHFTLDPRTGLLRQHIPLSKAGRALAHPSGVPETNRAHAYQVELVCYSSETVAKQVGGLAVPNLTDRDYENIAKLARWIERNANVPRTCHVTFKHYPESAGTMNGVRMGGNRWLDYRGHCGHQHVPGNDHGDPSNMLIAKILAVEPKRKFVLTAMNKDKTARERVRNRKGNVIESKPFTEGERAERKATFAARVAPRVVALAFAGRKPNVPDVEA